MKTKFHKIALLSLFVFFSPVFSNRVHPYLVFDRDGGNDSNSGEQKAKEKKNPSPTNWGGNTLVQEDREVQGAKITTFILDGGAWFFHNKVKLESNKLEIFGTDAVAANLIGGIKITDSEKNSVLYAKKGDYDKFKSVLTLKGNPTLHHTDSSNKKILFQSEEIQRNLDTRQTFFKGKVLISGENFLIQGEDAVFEEDSEILTMSNFPFIMSEEFFANGEKLIYDRNMNVIGLEGNAKIFTLNVPNSGNGIKDKFQKKEASKAKESNTESKTSAVAKTKNAANSEENSEDAKAAPKEKELNIFSGNRLIYQSGEEGFIFMEGEARYLSPSGDFKADKITAKGKNKKDLLAEGNVSFLDMESATLLRGELLEHFDETQYSHVTNDSKIEFLNKETKEVSSTLKAAEIERFGDRKEIVTRGDVEVETPSSKIFCEFGTYFEETEIMVLEGNPILDKEGDQVRSGKITLYPKEDRAILSDGIRVGGN